MSKFAIKNHWIEVVLVVLLVGVTILSIGWHIYRYGGDYYYMRVNGSSGSFPVTVPGGITQNGYVYRGIAKGKYGNRQRLEVHTVADDLGPFHKGQIIRITYKVDCKFNPNFWTNLSA
ncbi:YxeA family protein [Lactiplantibacillus plantarum]|nr:YxeA family protein [Lactiplantibacillus plantarum]MCG0882610.1 YxeA family protein [Lactiplantibacillus plantarum]